MTLPLSHDIVSTEAAANVPAADPLADVRRSLAALLLSGPCFVGFSGGIDSTALLLLLREAGLAVTAVHFQHGLRGADAEADAAWCEAFCAARGLPCRVIRLEVPRHRRSGESTEEAARRLRLEQWQRLATPQTPVFLAHHADDALEELFLRLARGANATGLTSLRPCRLLGGVMFLRPLLGIRKAQLREYLLQQGVTDWRTDATNAANDYRRNAVRNRLLPLATEIFGTEAGFFQALDALRQDADYLEEQARRAVSSLRSLRDWQALPPALLPRVFRLWRQMQDGVDAAPPRSFVQALAQALAAGGADAAPCTLQLSPAVRLRLTPQGLRWLAEAERPSEPFCLAWHWRESPVLSLPQAGMTLLAAVLPMPPERGGTPQDAAAAPADGWCEYFRLADMPDCLTVRSWQPGDTLVPFGRKSAKKLQDLFTDARVSVPLKHRLPLLLADSRIIWVPSVRRAEYARCTADGTVLAIHAVSEAKNT